MAFLIPDNLKSRKDVPSDHRRVVEAFEVGLDEGVTAWYEPLFDPEKEKPHFVLLLPTRGIVVLEVLGVQASAVLGVFRGHIRIIRDGQECEAEALKRADRLAQKLQERISREERLKALTIPIASGAVFPLLSRQEAEQKGLSRIDLSRCVFREEVDAARNGTGEASLMRSFARMWGNTDFTGLQQEHEKTVRGLIQPEIVIDKVAETFDSEQLSIFRPPLDEEDAVRVMDRQQEAMAKSLGTGHRIIRGVAGSGKTLVLVYRAKLLAKLTPQSRYLFTCFTRSLAGQIRELLQEHQNIDVVNLDQLMGRLIRQARLRHPGYETDDSGDLVAATALQALERGSGNRYDGVFVDEAQDFSTQALRVIVRLLKSGSEDLVIVADAAQKIFKRNSSWAQAGIQAQGRTKILRINYRNTRQVLQFASAFLLAGQQLHPERVPDGTDENAIIPPESALRTGPAPSLSLLPDANAEIAGVVDQVKAWMKISHEPRTIAVLYASSRNGSGDFPSQLLQTMSSHGIPVYWGSDPRDKASKDRLASAAEPVVLCTIQSAKGLEFPNVVLCSVWREGDSVDDNRKLIYVGMTRATNRLAIVTRRGHPLAGDVEAALRASKSIADATTA
jgi:hypothetical protein